MVRRREGRRVPFHYAVVGLEVLQSVAHHRTVGSARLAHGARQQLEPIVAVGHAHLRRNFLDAPGAEPLVVRGDDRRALWALRQIEGMRLEREDTLRVLYPRPLQVIIGDPIRTTGLTTRDADALTQRVRDVITATYLQNHPETR